MLIITEKPSVARQFASALRAVAKEPFTWRNEKDGITVTHCRGHLLEAWDAVRYDIRMKSWCYEALPVIPVEFRYGVIKDSAKILAAVCGNIREAVKKGDEILVATDAGREGEVIARLVLSYAKADGYEKTSRFWVSESTAEPKVVRDGIAGRLPLKNYDGLAKLGLAWKKCDWIYGINMTVLFTLLARDGGWRGKRRVMNTGRVQSAVLREIYRRQREIENFRSVPYRELEIRTENGITAYLVKPNGGGRMFVGDSGYIENAERSLLENRMVLVGAYREEKTAAYPPLLYNTGDLQKDAWRVLGFSPAKTLSLMQKLYEEEGTLSYPRTPSRVLGEGNENLAKSWIEEQLNNEGEDIRKKVDAGRYTAANRRLFDNAKLEDHYGLVPLKYMGDDGSDAYRVWRLVQIRFLMQGMEKNVVCKTFIELEKRPYRFVGGFVNVEKEGWKEYEAKPKKKDGGDGGKEFNPKTPIRAGMVETVKGWKVLKRGTRPPELYNYATIIAFMQNPKGEGDEGRLAGIGTEATRAAHIRGLEENGYVTAAGGGLTVTEKGGTLMEMISGIPEMRDGIRAAETTEWEALGGKDPDELLRRTEDMVRAAVESAKAGRRVIEREVLGKCPKCGKNVFEGDKVYFCEEFKNKKCGFTVWKETGKAEITGIMLRSMLAGGTVGKVACEGKNGRKYTADFRINGDGDLVIKEN